MTVRGTLWRAALALALVAVLGQPSGSMASAQQTNPKRKPMRVVWMHQTAAYSGTERPRTASMNGAERRRPGVRVQVRRPRSATGSTPVALPSRDIVVSDLAAVQRMSPPDRANRSSDTRSLRGVQEYLGGGEQQPELRFEAAAAQQRPVVETGRARRSPAPVRRSSGGTYVLGAGDVLDVFVWRNAELSREVPVRPDGFISLPLAGEVVATGKTVQQLQDEITVALAEYVQVPTVTVTVTQIRSLVVYVLGNVAKPGPLQLDRQVTPLQAIAMAGGLTEFADKNDITILRTVNGREQRIEFRYGDFVKGKGNAGEVLLRAGDVVYVP